MTKEEVRQKLIENYNDHYNNYISVKAKQIDFPQKGHTSNKSVKNSTAELTYLWKFGNDDGPVSMENEPQCYIVELALEGMPEAYYEALRHTEFVEKYAQKQGKNEIKSLLCGECSIFTFEKKIKDFLAEFYTNNCLGENKKIQDASQKLLSKANMDARNEWRLKRETIFSGPSGFYDEGSWNWIEEMILPYATRDVWESLHEFFSPDAFIPEEDIKRFEECYNQYLLSSGNTPQKVIAISPKITKLNGARAKNKIPKKKDVSKIEDYQVFVDMLFNKPEKKVTCDDLIYAYYAEQNISKFDSEINKFDNCSIDPHERIIEIFRNAEENVCLQFIKSVELTCNDAKWQVIKRIFRDGGGVPCNWFEIISKMINTALSDSEDSIRIWIGFIIDCDYNMFQKLIGDNIQFWKELEIDKAVWMFNLVMESTDNSNAEKVRFLIYKLIFKNREDNDVMQLWVSLKKDFIMHIIVENKYENKIVQMKRFQDLVGNDEKENSELIFYLLKYMNEMSGSISYDNQVGFSKEKFLIESREVSHRINRLKDQISKLKTDKSISSTDSLTIVAKGVDLIKDAYDYFVDHWMG